MNKIRYIALAITLSISTISLWGQNPRRILQDFKEKKINHVSSNSIFPFKIEIGSPVDDKKINNQIQLKTKLEYLFDNHYLDNINQGAIIRLSRYHYAIEIKSFNDENKLESESSILFYFKLIKGKWKLNSVSIAG